MNQATVHSWTAGSRNGSTPGNRSPSGVPGGADIAKIVNRDGVARTITYDYNAPAFTIGFLNLGLNGGAAGAADKG